MTERIAYEDDYCRLIVKEAAPPLTPPPPVTARSPLYDLVNGLRQMASVPHVQRDENAEQVAQAWAEELARQGPTAFKRQPHNPNLTSQIKGEWFAFGENVAYGQPDEKAVHEAWTRSRGHFRNMADRRFTHMGVGRAVRDGTPYWVEVFIDRLP
jgi:uncharacterized protein YkwD